MGIVNKIHGYIARTIAQTYIDDDVVETGSDPVRPYVSPFHNRWNRLALKSSEVRYKRSQEEISDLI